MKKTIYLVLLLSLLAQSCSQEYPIEDVSTPEKKYKELKIKLPKEIENYGRAVATELKKTVTNMTEQGVDYSRITESAKFRETFQNDWYAANPQIVKTRSSQILYPMEMSTSEFIKRYKMLTTIQIDYIKKIIHVCRNSESNTDMLQRLIDLRDEIYLSVPEIEQDRLLYVVSALFYGIQMISTLEAEGLMIKTPYNYNELQFTQIHTRAEYIPPTVSEGCRSFLATTWAIAVGEPTPAGEVVALVTTVIVAGVLLYEVITCRANSLDINDCIEKYEDCMEFNPAWAAPGSGNAGSSMCDACLKYCQTQNVWDCPRPI